MLGGSALPIVAVLSVVAISSTASEVPQTDGELFGFSPVFGDWMVLQQAPAVAAVYGAVPTGATGVQVTVDDGKSSYMVTAEVGATEPERGSEKGVKEWARLYYSLLSSRLFA